MSLATRCPHCNTIFKVVQDQLKVSEGWVRCGRCNEVFNALEGLFDMDREPPPQRTPATSAPEPEPPPSAPVAPTAPSTEPDWSRAPRDLLEPSVPGTPEEAIPPGFDDMAQVAPEPDRDRQAVTNFELELPPSALDARVMTAAVTAEPAAPAPPARPATEALPVTEESDALDSRYLLPSSDERKPLRRRRRGPDFADAQFPTDAMADAEDLDWMDTDTGRIDPVLGGTVEHPPLETPVNRSPERQTSPIPDPVSQPQRAEPQDMGPSTIPSRFGDDFRPEQSLPPPSQRKGKPGTRGRPPQAEAPEFIKQAERKAIWRHPVMRATLAVMALLLTALLGLQVAHHWRDSLAAHYPGTAPWLAQWCHLAGCKVSAPMQIDDLQVDNIALVKTTSEGPDSYRLTAIIHNRADIALAWPQLDLTLTDSNGEVVARRAFAASDARRVPAGADNGASAPDSPVPEAVPAGASTTLQWHLRAPDLHLAGYTAELFYP